MNQSNQLAGGYALALLLILFSGGTGFAQKGETPPAKPTPEQRSAQLLKRFPESDANKDGILTRAEALAFMQRRREGMKKRTANKPVGPGPTHADVSYGDHEKQAFDIWLVPDATGPTPVVIFIHGGGFRSGDKSAAPPAVIEQYLKAGVAFIAMNYRLSDVGPFPMMMEDAARGLQTVRHRSAEWNLDPKKVACYGGSAGAGISLWLAFHDDLADSDNEDPIARQSTRITAAGALNGQSTYDIRTFREWFQLPDLQPGPALPAFYAVEANGDWESERVRKLMTEASPITHLTRDDIPVYMIYGRPNTTVTAETGSSEWVHHVQLGLKLQEAMNKLNLDCIVNGKDVVPENDPYGSVEAFLISRLKD